MGYGQNIWDKVKMYETECSSKVFNIIDYKRTILRAILIIDIYDSFTHVN